MASAVSPLSGSSNATNSSNSASSLTSAAPSESMFLNLLDSQIQNQDPLNPTDSTQFVSQLAQFSELEQVIAIRSDTDTLAHDATSAAGSSGTANGSAGSSSDPASGADNPTGPASSNPTATAP